MNTRKTLEHYIDEHFQETLKDIQKIVKIKTVKEESTNGAPFGLGLKKGLEETLKIAKDLGFKTVNLDNYIGYAEFGEGEEYIGVLGHIDVVPEGEHSKWSVPPFSGEIVGKNMISRGALDNKGPIISALHSMKALKECVPTFNHRVRIIFGTNEESGDEDIKYYLSKEKAPKYAFTPDGQFPVVFSEKGIYTFSFKDSFLKEKTSILDIVGGTRSNVVPEEAKVFLKKDLSEKIIKELEKFKDTPCKFEVLEKESYLEVICKGIPAHASSPQRGVNPITWLFRFLNRVIPEEDSLKRFVNFMDKVVGIETDGSGLNIETKNEETGDLTLSCGIVKIIEEKKSSIYVKFNIRYPVTTNEKKLDTILDKIGRENNVEFVKENHNAPLYFPKEHPLVEKLQKVFKDVTDRDDKPVALGGGTYAKLMPNTVAFGPNFKEFRGNPHGFDEKMDIDMLKQGMLMYALGVLELA
ncbi:dipeptidase PepV [Cetobacterium somerae]|uniref:dipeptidase PepV n=2 Tax=Cetobacterium TaxID=180162 RepID=UPI001F062DE3|nr:dipeptidase PepV [Cetobacterium somerae]UPO97510.1 dipeptidase PepV [Cetobacterium somerae]